MSEKSVKTNEELLIIINQLESKISVLEKAKLQSDMWLDNSPVCTKIIDLDLNLKYMSESGIRDLKIDDITTFYGKPYPLHFYPDSFKIPTTKNLKKAIETGEIITQEAPIRDIEGKFLWYHSTIIPVYNHKEQLDYLMVVSMEITEKKLAEKVLKESTERFELAMLASQDGLFDWNLVTNEIYYSPRWKSMLGYNDDELPNDFSIWENLTEAKDVKKSWEMQQELINKQRDRFELEFKMKHKDGHWVDVLSRADAVFDKKGEAVRIVGTHVDISERKQAEILLRESEMQLRLSMNAAKAGSWIWNIETDEVIWDSRMQEIFGFEPGSFDGKYESWKKVVHPDDSEEADKHKIEALKNGTDYDFEYRLNIEHEVGTWRTVKAKAIVISNEEGKRIRMAGFCEDISEKKKEEEKIRIVEEKLKNTFNISPAIIAKANLRTGYFIEVNQAVTRILGYSIEEFKSKPFVEFIHPEDRNRTDDTIAKKLEGNHSTFFENRYLCKDGNYKWLAWNGTETDKNGVVTTIGSDIDERKQAEKEIKKSQSLLQQAEEISNQGAWEWDITQDEWTFSDNWLRIHGCELSGIKREELMTIAHPDDAESVEKAFQDALNGDARYDLEHRIVRQNDGEVRYVKAIGDFILNDSGIRIKMYGVTQDITVKKQSEELLKESEAQLKFAQQSAGAGLWDWDMVTDKIVWSPELFSLFGLDSEHEGTSFETWDKCMHPDDKESAYEKLNISIKEHIQLNNEYRVIHPNGKILWINAIGKTSYDDQGNPIRNAGICIDITERKQAEEKIRAAEKSLKNTVDLSPSIIAKADIKTGKFFEVSPAVTRILGYSVEEFTSKPYMEFVHLDDIQRTIDELSQQMSVKDVSFIENRYLCKDGSYKWISWYNTKPDKNGVISCVGSDINERKIAALKLIQSKQLLEASQTIAKLGGWELDIPTNSLFWTAETYRLHDTSPEEFNPTVDAGVGYFLPESRLTISKALKAAMEDGIGYDLELKTLTTKGRLIEVRTTCDVTMVDGKPTKLTGIFQDITNAKEIEHELIRAKEKAEKSEERLSGFMASATDGFMLFDSELNQIDINDVALRITKQKREEIIGRNILEVVPDLKKSGRYDKFMEVIGTGNPIIFDDIVPHAKFGDIRISLKVFKVGQGLGIILTDITERKKAEELLKVSEERFRKLYTDTPSIMHSMDKDGRIQNVSKRWLEKLGYEMDEVIGHKSTEFLTDKSRQIAVEQYMPKFMKEGFIDNVSYQYLTKGGDVLDILLSAISEKDENGNVKLSLAVLEDITERKLAEEALKESEEKYRSLIDDVLDTSSVGIFILDSEFKVAWINKATEKYFGIKRENVIGKDKKQLINSEIKGIFEDPKYFTKKVFNTYKDNNYIENFECHITTGKDREERWLSHWSQPITDGLYKNGRIEQYTDISELKKAKEKAVENSEKYRLLHENAGLGIGYYTTDGTVISFNSIASKDMNGVPEDFAGKSIFDLFPKEQADFYFDRIQKAIKSDEIEVYEDCVELPKQKKWFLSTYTKIDDSNNEVLGIQIISQNISDIKESEVELKMAKERAEESDKLKTAFLANMSHEIRTPMNGILGFVNLLNEPDLTNSQIDRYSTIIRKSGDRLLNTINDIIDISKIEAGEVVISRQETSLNNLLEEVHSFHLPEAKHKSLSLSIDSSIYGKQLWVNTDSNKLHGILSNLIKNAIKYTEEGAIIFGYEHNKDFIEFYVKDTGIGIPKNRIHAIFNRFEQADIEDKRAFEGSGLGLAISKAYVEMLGGSIQVKSEEAKGSIFTFTIPNNRIEEKEVGQTTETTQIDSSKIKKLNLLIADDEEVSSDLLMAYLKDQVDNITVVRNGEEAVEACRENPDLDLVLMDLKMPKMSGYNASREIRKFNKDIIIIAQTAYALPGDEKKALKAGCNDYISKPIDKTLLLEIIISHLS